MKKVNDGPRIRQLYNGDYVRVRGVSPALIDSIQGRVPDPKAPVILLDTGEEMVNYNDPVYQAALAEAEERRNVMALHTVIMFGLELVDENGEPIEAPADKKWERSLKRAGVDWRKVMLDFMNEEEFDDEEDEKFARHDAYMLLTAFSGTAQDLAIVREISGADAAAQAAAEAQFPS